MSEEKPNKAVKSYEIKRIKDLPQAQQAALDELALLEQYQRLHALRTLPGLLTKIEHLELQRMEKLARENPEIEKPTKLAELKEGKVVINTINRLFKNESKFILGLIEDVTPKIGGDKINLRASTVLRGIKFVFLNPVSLIRLSYKLIRSPEILKSEFLQQGIMNEGLKDFLKKNSNRITSIALEILDRNEKQINYKQQLGLDKKEMAHLISGIIGFAAESLENPRLIQDILKHVQNQDYICAIDKFLESGSKEDKNSKAYRKLQEFMSDNKHIIAKITKHQIQVQIQKNLKETTQKELLAKFKNKDYIKPIELKKKKEITKANSTIDKSYKQQLKDIRLPQKSLETLAANLVDVVVPVLDDPKMLQKILKQVNGKRYIDVVKTLISTGQFDYEGNSKLYDKVREYFQKDEHKGIFLGIMNKTLGVELSNKEIFKIVDLMLENPDDLIELVELYQEQEVREKKAAVLKQLKKEQAKKQGIKSEEKDKPFAKDFTKITEKVIDIVSQDKFKQYFDKNNATFAKIIKTQIDKVIAENLKQTLNKKIKNPTSKDKSYKQQLNEIGLAQESLATLATDLLKVSSQCLDDPQMLKNILQHAKKKDYIAIVKEYLNTDKPEIHKQLKNYFTKNNKLLIPVINKALGTELKDDNKILEIVNVLVSNPKDLIELIELYEQAGKEAEKRAKEDIKKENKKDAQKKEKQAPALKYYDFSKLSDRFVKFIGGNKEIRDYLKSNVPTFNQIANKTTGAEFTDEFINMMLNNVLDANKLKTRPLDIITVFAKSPGELNGLVKLYTKVKLATKTKEKEQLQGELTNKFIDFLSKNKALQKYFKENTDNFANTIRQVTGVELSNEVAGMFIDLISDPKTIGGTKDIIKLIQGKKPMDAVIKVCDLLNDNSEFLKAMNKNNIPFQEFIASAMQKMPAELHLATSGYSGATVASIILQNPGFIKTLLKKYQDYEKTGEVFTLDNLQLLSGNALFFASVVFDEFEKSGQVNLHKPHIMKNIIKSLLTSKTNDLETLVKGQITDYKQQNLQNEYDGIIKASIQSPTLFNYQDLKGNSDKELKLENVTIKNLQFVGTNLEHVSFKNSKFVGTPFLGAKFDKVSFENCILENVSFDKAVFNGKVNFKGATIDGKTLATLAPLIKQNKNILLDGVKIIGDLSNLDLSGISLKGADLSGVTKVTNTNFKKTDLDRVIFNKKNSNIFMESINIFSAKNFTVNKIATNPLDQKLIKSAQYKHQRKYVAEHIANAMFKYKSKARSNFVKEVQRIYHDNTIIGENFRKFCSRNFADIDKNIKSSENIAVKNMVSILEKHKNNPKDLKNALIINNLAEEIIETLPPLTDNNEKQNIIDITTETVQHLIENNIVTYKDLVDKNNTLYKRTINQCSKIIKANVTCDMLGVGGNIYLTQNAEEQIKSTLKTELILSKNESKIVDEIATGVAANLFGKGENLEDAKTISNILKEQVVEFKKQNPNVDLTEILKKNKEELIGKVTINTGTFGVNRIITESTELTQLFNELCTTTFTGSIDKLNKNNKNKNSLRKIKNFLGKVIKGNLNLGIKTAKDKAAKYVVPSEKAVKAQNKEMQKEFLAKFTNPSGDIKTSQEVLAVRRKNSKSKDGGRGSR
ncbi:MAG: pentapeptide repeat-containing protein [Rickettsiaceae bacterium]|nr:pentapeptide repeat-containing protein [Rickettsiaceae bacterium]